MLVMVTTAWSSRSEIATGPSQFGQAPPMPTRRAKVPQLSQLAEVPVAAVGAFVDGDLPAGPGGREITVGSSCWCRRRNAVFRHAVLQYNWRPTGV